MATAEIIPNLWKPRWTLFIGNPLFSPPTAKYSFDSTRRALAKSHSSGHCSLPGNFSLIRRFKLSWIEVEDDALPHGVFVPRQEVIGRASLDSALCRPRGGFKGRMRTVVE